MGDLTQASLLGILKPVITDEEIARSLVKCVINIFDISPPDPGVGDPVESVINQIIEHSQRFTGEGVVEIPGLRNTLIRMLGGKEFYAFARVLRMLRDLFGYSESRLMNYIKKFKFQIKFNGEFISPWIDVRRTAEAILEELNPSRLRIFAGLDPEERCLLQGFTSEQIDVMSTVGPRGIDILSRINHVHPNEKAMILGLKLTEGSLFKDIGFRKIRLLSELGEDERDRFFTLGMSIDPKERTRFLQRYSLDTPERQDLLYKLASMETKDLDGLRGLIVREKTVLRSMSEPAGDLAERMGDLTAEEKEGCSHLTPKQLIVLRNLDTHHRIAVKKFENLKEVMDVANNLSSDQRNSILSLRRNEIEALCGNGIGEKLRQAERIASYSQEIFQNSEPLTTEEKVAIMKLNQLQRSVLAKAYVLGHDGLFLISKLGIEATIQVLRGNDNLTVMQLALKKKLDLDILNVAELPQFFEVMEHEAKNVLLDLSWKGIKLLSKMADLNENMMRIVEESSDDWMGVLIANDKLTGTEILMLEGLGEMERKVLINLNLNQREYLSDKLDFTELSPDLFNREQRTVIRNLGTKGLDVLRRIILLSENEQRLIAGLRNPDTTALSTMDAVELNLFASLSFDEFRSLSSFVVWHSEEELAFRFLAMKTEASLDDRILQTRRYLATIPESLSMEDEHNHFSLMAGTIETLRINGIVKDDYVTSMPELMEVIPIQTSLSLIFTLHLLKFSMKDLRSLRRELLPRIIDLNDELLTINMVDRIRTIEDLTFIRWILSEPPDPNNRALFELAQGNFIRLSYRLTSGHEFGIILSETDQTKRKQVFQNLRHMLTAHEFFLASCFFFLFGQRAPNEAKVRSIKFITDVLDPNDCFEFLTTTVNAVFIEQLQTIHYPDILSDSTFQEPNIFEASIYYNRGNVLPLAERLERGQLWGLLERRPLPLLVMMVRNLQIGLIKLYKNVGTVDQLISENRMQIFGIVMEYLRHRVIDFSREMFLDMGRVIRILGYWDPFVGNDIYKNMISEYMNLIDGRASVRAMRTLLDHFVSDDVSLEELFRAMEHVLGRESYFSLRNEAREGCTSPRMKRDAGIKCVDSRNTEEITSEVTQRMMQGIDTDETQTKLYNELLEYSEARFKGGQVDPQVQRALISKMEGVPPESLDPRIKDIVDTIRDPQLFDSALKQSGTLKKLEKVSSIAGSVFTLFMVGKHMAHGDVKSLGYDALYLWVLPEIGERMTNLLVKENPIVGPVIGQTVGNFAAFLGLVQSIKARESAVDQVDEEIADLSIVTNTALIALNVPTVAKQIMTGSGMEIGVIGELSGPVGAALTVSVIVGSYLVGLGLGVEQVTRHIELSSSEKLSLYWDFFWDQPVPKQLQIDIAAENMFTKYISDHIHRLKGTYDNIALSLPSFLITEGECIANPDPHNCDQCTLGDKNTSFTLEFSRSASTKYPFSANHQRGGLIFDDSDSYDLVCGPSTEHAHQKIPTRRTSHTCASNSSHRGKKWSIRSRELFIPSNPDDECVNVVFFGKHGAPNSSKMFFYLASDTSIELSNENPLDIVFHGRDISIEDRKSTEPKQNNSVNRYYFQNQLRKCYIHKRGYNFFYVEGGKFECDLGNSTEDRHNTVMIHRNFIDRIGIHSIIGSTHREKIEANFAEFVDGSGGGDVIRATRNIIVRGYVNDLITGDCTVMLPFNISEIAKVLTSVHMTILNGQGLWIEVDGNARLITADDFLLTPIKISNDTRRVIRAHVKKSVKDRIYIEEQLPLLRKLTIPNCKLVKEITSANYDIVLSELGTTVFHMDKNTHWYYWEAADRPGSLFIFRKFFAKVTISNANGILDFKELQIDPTSDRVKYHWIPEGGLEVTVGGLQVNLLPNYGNVTITFDRKKYFKLGKSGMCRDWCSHSLRIVGKIVIDGVDLYNNYNCFEFRSHKVLFLRLGNDLVLVSSKGILTIGKYYSHIHEGMELSLKLRGGRIMEAPVFQKRASRPHKLIYYEIGGAGLQIFHNQPVDEHHIGFLDLKNKSIKDFEMMMNEGRLLLSYRNSTLVLIENWANYEPVRGMMFAFEDSFLPNAECVLSSCDPDDIIEEFDIEKRKRSVTNNASRGFSWINGLVNAIVNPIRTYYATLDFYNKPYINEFDAEFCTTSNMNLGLLLLQTYLNRRFPVPKSRSITMVETLTSIIDLVEEREGNNNSFQLYTDIAELVRYERYHLVSKLLHE